MDSEANPSEDGQYPFYDHDYLDGGSMELESGIDTQLQEEILEVSHSKDIINKERKRAREVDDNEEWITVARGGKKLARSRDLNGSTRIPEEKIEICMTSVEKLPKQIGLARIFKAELISGIIRIKYINPYKVLIQFDKDVNMDKLMACPYFLEKKFRFQKSFEVGQSFGIIRDIEMELSDEEVAKSLTSDTEILSTKRLKRRDPESGDWELSEAVRVCFKGPSLPRYVFTNDMRVAVEPYVFPVTQCSKCWRYGHSVRICPSNKIVCPKCGGNHANCETLVYKCSNCSNKHMALAKICPIYVKERRLREIMADHNCTYRKALTLYTPPPPMSPQITSPRPADMAEKIGTSSSIPTEVNCSQNSGMTYAEIVKTTAEVHTQSLSSCSEDNISSADVTLRKPNKIKSKKSALKSKQPINNLTSERSSKVNSRNIDMEAEKDSPPCKKMFTCRELLGKLKEIIFAKRNSFEEKIKKCFNLVMEWIVNFSMSLISEVPIIGSLFAQNG